MGTVYTSQHHSSSKWSGAGPYCGAPLEPLFDGVCVLLEASICIGRGIKVDLQDFPVVGLFVLHIYRLIMWPHDVRCHITSNDPTGRHNSSNKNAKEAPPLFSVPSTFPSLFLCQDYCSASAESSRGKLLHAPQFMAFIKQ